MRHEKILIIFLIISICIIFFCGCGTSNDGKAKVRVGYFPNITHIQAVVGFSDSFFQDYLGKNIEIEKKTFDAGPAEVEAFMAKQLDIGYMGPVPAINCFSKTNGEIKIIAGACNNGSLLLTGKDSGIKSVAELAGKKVAVPQFGNTQDILLRRILKGSNLVTTDKGGTVTIIQSENANIMVLMERNLIDAAFVPEPWGTLMKKRLNSNILLNSEQIFDGNKYGTTVVVVRTKFLEKNPEIVEQWVKAHKAITQDIIANKNLYAEKFSNEILKLTGQKLDKENMTSAIENVDLSYEIPTLSMQNYIDCLNEAKLIERTEIMNDLIDSRFVK